MKPLYFRPLCGFVFTCVLVAPCFGQIVGRGAQSDIAQGEEVAQQVEQQIGLYRLPDAEAWVQGVGARLAAVANDSRWQFSFHIVDQAESNAFAIPGGGIYVSRGLLALINSEDELAGVLGHEIAHVTQRHSARQQRRGILPGLLTVPGNIVGSVLNENLGALINAPIKGVTGLGLSRYGRAQETESDRIGSRTAAGSGYDPAALGAILDRLERDAAAQSGEQRRASLFDSHPMTATRLSDIKTHASGLPRVQSASLATDVTSVFGKLSGLWWGANPEAGVFEENQFYHPVIGFTLAFPQGWTHSNTPAGVSASDPKEAATFFLGVDPHSADSLKADPQTIGQAFVQKMRTEAKAEPTSVSTTPVNGMPTYAVTYVDRSAREPVHLQFVWLRMADVTYRIVGMSVERRQETLRNIALSLRPMTTAERGAITGKRVRIVTAHEGETLEQVSTRTGNAWSVAYTSLVNGIASDAALSEGRPIKIVRTEAAWIAK